MAIPTAAELEAKLLDTTPIRSLSDKNALKRVLNDNKLAVEKKTDSNNRCKRYLHIFKALDPPDELMQLDESTGKIEEDESIYSNTFMPVGAAIVEAGVSQLMSVIYQDAELMSIEADDMEDMFFEERITAHLRKRLKEMKAKRTFKLALLQAGIFDYSVTGTRWLLQPGYQAKRKTQETTVEVGGFKFKERQVTSEMAWVPDLVDRSDVFLLNFFRCYHDWTSENGLEDSRFFIDHRWVPMEHLIAESDLAKPFGRYKNVDKVVKAVLTGIESTSAQATGDDDALAEMVKSRRVKVIRYWTRDHLVEVAHDTIIRRMNLFGWPLQVWSISDEPNAFGGLGWVQRMERNQLDINASMNDRRDYDNLIAHPFGIISKDVVGTGSPKMYPHRWVTARGDVDRKMAFYSPGVNQMQGTIQEVEGQIAMMERQARTSAAAQGAVSPGRTTATEIEEVSAGVGAGVLEVAEKIESDCLEPLYLNLFLLETMLLTKGERIRYFGRYGEVIDYIDPASYRWTSMPKFHAKGTLATVDRVQTQQFLMAIDKALQLPMIKHNWTNIGKEMWRRLHPKEYWKFVQDPNVPEENIPPEQEHILLAFGHEIRVSPLNDQNKHVESHERFKLSTEYQTWPAHLRLKLDQHSAEHQSSQPQAGGPTPGIQDSSDVYRGFRPPATQGAA